VSSIAPAPTAREPPFPVLNPLRSEEEAFRLLLYTVVVVAVIGGLIVIVRAIT
jgi:hypothetical protein